MFYFVPTPIGNIEDITLRAIRLFKECDVIIAEDPLKTSQLLKLLEIENKPKLIGITKNHNFNDKTILQIVNSDQYNTILIVSDAGMPGISDPGYLIVKMLKEHNKAYSVLPGPNAALSAVVASGLIVKEFVFLGFLPLKKGRQKEIKSINESKFPVVLYESNHRIKKLLNELKTILKKDAQVFVAREISKKFETFYNFKIGDENYESILTNIKDKGEFVVIIKV